MKRFTPRATLDGDLTEPVRATKLSSSLAVHLSCALKLRLGFGFWAGRPCSLLGFGLKLELALEAWIIPGMYEDRVVHRRLCRNLLSCSCVAGMSPEKRKEHVYESIPQTSTTNKYCTSKFEAYMIINRFQARVDPKTLYKTCSIHSRWKVLSPALCPAGINQ